MQERWTWLVRGTGSSARPDSPGPKPSALVCPQPSTDVLGPESRQQQGPGQCMNYIPAAAGREHAVKGDSAARPLPRPTNRTCFRHGARAKKKKDGLLTCQPANCTVIFAALQLRGRRQTHQPHPSQRIRRRISRRQLGPPSAGPSCCHRGIMTTVRGIIIIITSRLIAPTNRQEQEK